MTTMNDRTSPQTPSFSLTNSLLTQALPAAQLSVEAQRERKAGSGQTLTGLGVYKGRKPLILARALLLAALIPVKEDQQEEHEVNKALEIFELLMGFDNESLAKRCLEKNPPLKDLLPFIDGAQFQESLTFKKDKVKNDKVSWQGKPSREEKLKLYRAVMANPTLTYQEKSQFGKRPEECDQTFLYAHIWEKVNAFLGTNAQNHHELVQQLGQKYAGRNLRVGDVFCGGGSVPFEAARLGFDIYASDLSPVACLLTWGALNIVGGKVDREKLKEEKKRIAQEIDAHITALGIEHDKHGNRAKAYLYCTEVLDPQTGWRIPLAPSWVISIKRKTIAQLVPDPEQKRFHIEVVNNASPEEYKRAEKGTVQKGVVSYEIEGKRYTTTIKALRGDEKDAKGKTRNKLRPWTKHDYTPHETDIYQERLYCILWIDKNTQKTYYASVTDEDLAREEKVKAYVGQHLKEWQDKGYIPDDEIEEGKKTSDPIREKGYTHWHHLFMPRQLLAAAAYQEKAKERAELELVMIRLNDWNSKLSIWDPIVETGHNVFINQAYNTFFNFGIRAFSSYEGFITKDLPHAPIYAGDMRLKNTDAKTAELPLCDIWLTDPPYADAVCYEEIAEFFIAWLKKDPPPPLNEWVWDSRRLFAIKGKGEKFQQDMVESYANMHKAMPAGGVQIVFFTHTGTDVWQDLAEIFIRARYRVLNAWYISTETASGLKEGGYVQGTVILVLEKQSYAEKHGFKQEIIPEIRREVKKSVASLMAINGKRKDKPYHEGDFNIAAYAAALKVLTGYTHVGGKDLRTPERGSERGKDNNTDLKALVKEAASIAHTLLVPQGLKPQTWESLTGLERFVLRMLLLEAEGVQKLENYQNFAKTFQVEDYGRLMQSTKPEAACLKPLTAMSKADLSVKKDTTTNTPTKNEKADQKDTEPTVFAYVVEALQNCLKEREMPEIIETLKYGLGEGRFLAKRGVLIDMLYFIQHTSRDIAIKENAPILAQRLENLRLGE